MSKPRPALGWVFVDDIPNPPDHSHIIAVALDGDEGLVGHDVLVDSERPIELPLGGFAVRMSEITLVGYYE